MLSGVKLVSDLMAISENMSPASPPQKPLAKDSSHFGSHEKCEVGLDCLEFSSFQTVWLSEAPHFSQEAGVLAPQTHAVTPWVPGIPVTSFQQKAWAQKGLRGWWVTSWEKGQDGLPLWGYWAVALQQEAIRF